MPLCAVSCTGVAVGPNLVQWVQGLQQLASQQQVVQAAHKQQKAARKKDKVGLEVTGILLLSTVQYRAVQHHTVHNRVGDKYPTLAQPSK
jgi:hypothetical protein